MNSYNKEAVSGVKWTSLSSIIVAGGSFALILVLTNILDKKDFGLFALVNIVVGFSSEFVDIGISQAIIQKQQISNKQLSTLYWFNIILAILVFLAINASKFFIGNLYDEQELPTLLGLVSFSFLFSGISSQYQALLQKNLRFKLMAGFDIVAFIVYICLTLSLAYLDYGVYALIWGTLARTVVKTILLLINGLKSHIPIFYFNIGEVKNFINFGSYRTGALLVNFASSQLDSILIGKYIGVTELGVYDIFKRLIKKTIQITSPLLSKIIFPILSKLHDSKEKYKKATITYFEISNIIRVSMLIFISIFSKEIIILLMNDNWISYSYILIFLAFIFIFKSMYNFIDWIFLSSGKANYVFNTNLISFLINLICIYSIINFGTKILLIVLLLINISVLNLKYFKLFRFIKILNSKFYLRNFVAFPLSVFLIFLVLYIIQFSNIYLQIISKLLLYIIFIVLTVKIVFKINIKGILNNIINEAQSLFNRCT